MLSILSAATLSIFLAERRLINVIPFLIFVFGGNILSSSKSAGDVTTCTEYKRFNISIMDCTRIKEFTGLPDYLSPNIQGLNISRVRLSKKATNDTFAKFKDSLLLLDYSNTYFRPIGAAGIYVILSKLEYLDISHNCLSHLSMADGLVPVFPISLKVLKMSGCPMNKLNISNLISLEEFYMVGAWLQTLPTFSFKAPLRVLDLSRNNHLLVTPMDFAQFCTLQTVVLNFEQNYGLNRKDSYCLCMSLKNWFAKTIIKASMTCNSPSLLPDCHKADLKEANASAIYAHRCFPSPQATWRWWLSLPLIMLLLVMITACLIVIKRRHSNQAQSALPIDVEEEEMEIFEESVDTT